MRRLAVFVLIASVGHASVALAGEPILSVATRVARDGAQAKAPVPPKPAVVTSAQRSWVATLAQEQPAVSSSGMRKRTKVLLLLGAAVGFAASAYVIDHKVEDSTPSTLGTRED